MKIDNSTNKKQEYTHDINCPYNTGHDCECGEKTPRHSNDCEYNIGHDCNCAVSNYKTNEEQITELSDAQKERQAALNAIGKKMKDVNNIFDTAKQFKDTELEQAARQKLFQLAKQKYNLEQQEVVESKSSRPKVRKVTGKDGVAEFEVLNSVGVLVKKFASKITATNYLNDNREKLDLEESLSGPQLSRMNSLNSRVRTTAATTTGYIPRKPNNSPSGSSARQFAAEDNEGVDTIEMDVALFIRCLEWAKEDAADDVALHKFTENVVAKNKILTMDDYEMLVPQGEIVEAKRRIADDTWPEGHARSRFNVDGTRKDKVSTPKVNWLASANKHYALAKKAKDAGDMDEYKAEMANGNFYKNKNDANDGKYRPKDVQEGAVKNKQAQVRWMEKFENEVVAADKKHAGKIDWSSAKHLFNLGKGPDEAAEQYVKNRVDEDATGGASCSSAIATGAIPNLFTAPIKRAKGSKGSKVQTPVNAKRSAVGQGIYEGEQVKETKMPVTANKYPDNEKGLIAFMTDGKEVDPRYVIGLGFPKQCEMQSDGSVQGVWAVDSYKTGARVIVYMAGYPDPLGKERTTNDFESGKIPLSIVKKAIESGRATRTTVQSWKLKPEDFAKLEPYFNDVEESVIENKITEASPTGSTEELKVGDQVRVRDPNTSLYGKQLRIIRIIGDKFYAGGNEVITLPYERRHLELLDSRKIDEIQMKPVRTYKVGGPDDPALKATLKAASSREDRLSGLREEPIDWQNLGWDKIKQIFNKSYGGLGGEIVDIINSKQGFINIKGNNIAAVRLTIYVEYNLEDYGHEPETIKQTGIETGISDAINITLYRDPVNPKIIKAKY